MSIPDNPYRQSEFLISAFDVQQFPPDRGREVAFVGRSNVGKSSIINSLTDQKRLAKTSKTPGRTRQINFFTVDEDVRLVDLPGYGFARVDQGMKNQWRKLINAYFSGRDCLAGLILIVDIRRQPGQEDVDMVNWCQAAGIPVHLLVNKADKLPYQQRQKALQGLQKAYMNLAVSLQAFSVPGKTGIEELIAVLNGWLYPGKTRPRY